MSKSSIPLNNIKIAAPCPADWNAMVGSDRVRFCGQCSLNVYNLSSMSRREAEDLIEKTEGRLCVRYYQRKDGTVLTDNCPVGLRALKKRVNRIASAAISAVLSFAAGIGIYSAVAEKEVPYVVGKMEYINVTQGALAPLPVKEAPEPRVGQIVVPNIDGNQYSVLRETKIKKSSRRNRRN